MYNHKDNLTKYRLSETQLSSNPIRRKEEKDFIIELKARNETLVLEQKRLQGRLKAASISIKKYKQEIESLTRRRAGKILSCDKYLSGCRQSVICDEKENVTCMSPNDCNIAASLKKQLATTKEETETLKVENENLRKSLREFYDKQRPFEEANFKETMNHSNRHSIEIEFRNLEAASIAQIKVQQEMRQKLTDCNDHIASLQSKLEAMERAHSQQKGNDKMTELIQENKMLEEKLAKLCQLPFLKDENKSIQEEKYIREIEDLDNQVDNYTEQIHVLSMDNNTLRHEMAAMERNFRALLQERNELLEHANTEKNEKRVAEVQTHSTQGRETTTQTESVVDVCDKSVSAIDSTDEEKHLIEIQNLKSSIKELSIIESFKSEKISNIKQNIECQKCSQNPLLSLEPDETLLYITVKDASIDIWENNFRGKTFVLVDVLDFESQVSHVVEEFDPKYNFQCSFKLKITGFLVDQLEKGFAWLEIYQVMNDDVVLIGKAKIQTEILIQSQEQQHTLSLDSPDGQTIGSINIYMRLLQNLSRIQDTT